MIVKLRTEHHFEFLSLKGSCRVSSESTNVKMPHCWKSYALAHLIIIKQCLAYYSLGHCQPMMAELYSVGLVLLSVCLFILPSVLFCWHYNLSHLSHNFFQISYMHYFINFSPKYKYELSDERLSRWPPN